MLRPTHLLGAALSAAGLTCSSAQAATTLDIDAGLRARGVTAVALPPAKLDAGRLTLPVRVATTSKGASLAHSGGLRLRAPGGRRVTITQIRAELGRTTAVRARVGATTRTLALATPGSHGLTVTSGRIAQPAVALRLGRPAARVIARALGLRSVPVRLGTLRATAIAGTTVPAASPPATTPAPGTPQVTPITTEPTPSTRPPGAIDVTSAAITWRLRDSFVQYLASGTASTDGAGPVSPATADAASNGCNSDGSVNDAMLAYQLHFPFAAGWFDPATGHASLSFGGSARFAYKAHGIDFTAGEPQLELDGRSSTATFRFAGTGNTDAGGKRDVLVDMDAGGAPAAEACAADPGPAGLTSSGTTHAYERLPGTIPKSSSGSVFAGYYQPGDRFGWMTITFTTA